VIRRSGAITGGPPDGVHICRSQSIGHSSGALPYTKRDRAKATGLHEHRLRFFAMISEGLSQPTPMLSTWLREVQFALGRAGSGRDAARLLAHTGYFHLANRGYVSDRPGTASLKISVGYHSRQLTLRTGRIGDLFTLYEVLAFNAYHISPTLIVPDKVETIIDCGANIGLTSLYFASAYPCARIYSVEADPENFAVLTSNAAGESRILPIHGCIVSRSQSTVRFDNQRPAYARKLGTSGIRVPAITLDALLNTHGIRRVDLLKMDIEGAEREVLAEGQYLRSVQHLIVELHNGYSFSDFSEAVAIHGLHARYPDEKCRLVTAHR
jgi:FkbM family methyltransferase